jgi:TonB family protein
MMTSTRSTQAAWRKTVLSLAVLLLLSSCPILAQEPICKSRSGEVKVAYPDFARRMKIYGVVRLHLQLATGGAVRDSKVLGGNPVLATAAQQAVKSARFENAESCVITFEFKE